MDYSVIQWRGKKDFDYPTQDQIQLGLQDLKMLKKLVNLHLFR